MKVNKGHRFILFPLIFPRLGIQYPHSRELYFSDWVHTILWQLVQAGDFKMVVPFLVEVIIASEEGRFVLVEECLDGSGEFGSASSCGDLGGRHRACWSCWNALGLRQGTFQTLHVENDDLSAAVATTLLSDTTLRLRNVHMFVVRCWNSASFGSCVITMTTVLSASNHKSIDPSTRLDIVPQHMLRRDQPRKFMLPARKTCGFNALSLQDKLTL